MSFRSYSTITITTNQPTATFHLCSWRYKGLNKGFYKHKSMNTLEQPLFGLEIKLKGGNGNKKMVSKWIWMTGRNKPVSVVSCMNSNATEQKWTNLEIPWQRFKKHKPVNEKMLCVILSQQSIFLACNVYFLFSINLFA